MKGINFKTIIDDKSLFILEVIDHYFDGDAATLVLWKQNKAIKVRTTRKNKTNLISINNLLASIDADHKAKIEMSEEYIRENVKLREHIENLEAEIEKLREWNSTLSDNDEFIRGNMAIIARQNKMLKYKATTLENNVSALENRLHEMDDYSEVVEELSEYKKNIPEQLYRNYIDLLRYVYKLLGKSSEREVMAKLKLVELNIEKIEEKNKKEPGVAGRPRKDVDVVSVMLDRREGKSLADIMKKHGIGKSTYYDILNGVRK